MLLEESVTTWSRVSATRLRQTMAALARLRAPAFAGDDGARGRVSCFAFRRRLVPGGPTWTEDEFRTFVAVSGANSG